jgi:rhamnopyranosyl-N-acetylglucosaminyl-diphospho-decaprenol beta-1,3/1,4-galactofuranosyltransferase
MNRLPVAEPFVRSSGCEQKQRCFDIVSIVVTYNRKKLLLNCLDLLINQTMGTDILVIDNASTDGTENELKIFDKIDEKRIHYIYLDKNTGGAGGFYHGLRYAVEKGWKWFWLMDDDAEPRLNALEEIYGYARNKNHIYGSAAVSNSDGGSKLCFPTKIILPSKIEIIEKYNELSTVDQVAWLPFLGFFVNRSIIEKIGFPDKTLFIRNDDIEYAEKAKRKKIKFYIVKSSVIRHPFQPTLHFTIFGRRFYYRSMPSWKMYYEVRNKIIIAKRHYSLRSGIKSFAGASLQIFLSIFMEKGKKAYLKAYIQGIVDGMMSV